MTRSEAETIVCALAPLMMADAAGMKEEINRLLNLYKDAQELIASKVEDDPREQGFLFVDLLRQAQA